MLIFNGLLQNRRVQRNRSGKRNQRAGSAKRAQPESVRKVDKTLLSLGIRPLWLDIALAIRFVSLAKMPILIQQHR